MIKKLFLIVVLISFTSFTQAQQAKKEKSIIRITATISKFHEKSELDKMNKSRLIHLYLERINVIVNRLPFIALTNKRGITLNHVGVPETALNKKMLDKQQVAITNFIAETYTCEKTLIPFADKINIIQAILTYESIIKELRLLNE